MIYSYILTKVRFLIKLCISVINIFFPTVLFQVYNSWKDTDFSTQWCYENYIQVLVQPIFSFYKVQESIMIQHM